MIQQEGKLKKKHTYFNRLYENVVGIIFHADDEAARRYTQTSKVVASAARLKAAAFKGNQPPASAATFVNQRTGDLEARAANTKPTMLKGAIVQNAEAPAIG